MEFIPFFLPENGEENNLLWKVFSIYECYNQSVN